MNNGVNNTVCPNCGASILNGATFCGNCGYNLNNNIGVVNNVINSMPSEPPKNNKFQDKKKLLIIIGVVLVVLVGGFIAFKVLNHSSNKTKMFSDDQLIPIKKDSKYGYINTDGKIVIEPIYLDVSEFYGDYAVVEKEEDKSQIIDKNGKVVIDSSYNPEYFEDLEVWLIKSSLYDKNLKQISGDGYKIYHIEDNYFQWNDRESKTVGIMNEKGKILYKYTFQSDENFMSIDSSDKDEDLKDLYCVVNIENKKYGIVNCKNGKLVYDFGDKKIFSNGDNTFKIYNSSMSEVLDNIFINNDKVLYHSNGKNVGLTYRNGYLHINDYSNYQTSYLDIKTGKIVDKVDNTTTVELSD